MFIHHRCLCAEPKKDNQVPHIIRFSIMQKKDIDVSLAVCRRLGMTPDEFAKAAYFDSINEAIRLLNEAEEKELAEAMSTVDREKAEADLGIESPVTGESDGQSPSRNVAGDSTEARGGTDVASNSLAESSSGSDETANT